MRATIKWALYRMLHNKSTYVLLLLLTGCSILLSGGISRHWSTDFDLNLLNISYAVSFGTIEEFMDWYHPFQYQWLVSAIGMTALLPVLVNLFPSFSSQEATVPVTMGRTRSQIFFAGLICYYLAAILLWLCCFLLGFVLSTIPFMPMFPFGYYARTIGLAVYLFLGYAGLSLAVALLFNSRFAGIVVSFIGMVFLGITRNSGIWNSTILADLLHRNGERTELWMWAVESHPTARQALVVILFPIITTFLACAVGLFQFHRKDLC